MGASRLPAAGMEGTEEARGKEEAGTANCWSGCCGVHTAGRISHMLFRVHTQHHCPNQLRLLETPFWFYHWRWTGTRPLLCQAHAQATVRKANSKSNSNSSKLRGTFLSKHAAA
ncbi:hypothetical protein ACLKA6_011093 [Drosophila palustris]